MAVKRLSFPILLAAGIFFAGTLLRGAEAGIEFTGYVRDDKGISFALIGVASGNSKWVTIGQIFEDCTVRSFDDVAMALSVTKSGTEFQLPLVRAKIKQVDSEPPPELKKRVLNNLRLLSVAFDYYCLENGVSRATYADLVNPKRKLKEIIPADGEDYRTIVFTVETKSLQVTTNRGYVISYQRQ